MGTPEEQMTRSWGGGETVIAGRNSLASKGHFIPLSGSSQKVILLTPWQKKFTFLLYENMRSENTTSCLLSRNQLSNPTEAIPATALQRT